MAGVPLPMLLLYVLVGPPLWRILSRMGLFWGQVASRGLCASCLDLDLGSCVFEVAFKHELISNREAGYRPLAGFACRPLTRS